MKEKSWLLNEDFGVLKEHTMLVDEDIVLVQTTPSSQVGTVKVDWLVIALLKSGSASVKLNGECYDLKPGDLMVAFPEFVVESMDRSGEMEVDSICLSKKMLSEAMPISLYNWDALAFLASHPVLPIDEEERARFSMYYSLLKDKLEHKSRLCYKESMRCLLKSFMYDFFNMVSRQVPVEEAPFTQGNNLFRSFFDIMAETYPKPRSVAYYAKLLNVTPKYLSLVCKQACGHTASFLIQRAVARDIAELLTYSDKSIKEIMVEMDFPSLSFFGKYVKKHFGMGPKEYRAKRLSPDHVEHHHEGEPDGEPDCG